MIPFTCPCCEVSHPPHRDGCDFHNDCPTDAEVFDEVSALRSEVARLREERRWIPVGERLPSVQGEDVLVAQGPWDDGSYSLDRGWWNGTQWMFYRGAWDMPPVAFWQPLPPPPGEGEVEG